MTENDGGGSAAIDFKAIRRCVSCLRRVATPDTICCAECMRNMPVPREGLQNTIQGIRAEMEATAERLGALTVYMPDELRPPWWRRLVRWFSGQPRAAPSE